MECLERRRLMVVPPGGFAFTLWYPDGYAGNAISEFVPMVNPTEADSRYRLWAHFETGERDLLIAEGTLRAGQRGGVTVSTPETSLVPRDRPYALRLESEVPLAASVSRYDRGATGEAMTARAWPEWGVTSLYRGEGTLRNFLVWQNTEPHDIEVTITFTRATAWNDDVPTAPEPVVLTFATGAMRRDGFSVDDLAELDALGRGVPLHATVRATGSVVVAASSYDIGGTYTAMGSPYGPTEYWSIPLALLDGDVTDRLVVMNPSTETTTASVAARFADGTSLEMPDALRLEPGRALSMPLITLLATRSPGIMATVTVVGASPVYAAVVSKATTGDGGSAASYPSPGTGLGLSLHFAEGFIDPARPDVTETVALSNFGELLTVQNRVTVRLRFGDGSTWERSESLAPGATVLVVLSDDADLKRTISERGQYFFSIEVFGDFLVSAALRHTDGGFGPSGGELVILGEPRIELIAT